MEQLLLAMEDSLRRFTDRFILLICGVALVVGGFTWAVTDHITERRHASEVQALEHTIDELSKNCPPAGGE